MRKNFLPCWFTVFWVSLLFPGTPGFSAEAQSPPEPKEEGGIGEWWKNLERGIVDTGVFFAEGVEMFNPELAWVAGPLSFQSEYVRTFIHSGETGDPVFWGWYVQGSYFLTGEHRPPHFGFPRMGARG